MLVVEDGTGLSNAESYISVADADAYFAAFYLSSDPLLSAWSAAKADTGANAEIALRRSTRDLDVTYSDWFLSDPANTDQALCFPRSGIDGVPTAIKHATAELTLLLLNGYDITGPSDRSGSIKSVTEKLGPMESSVEYFTPVDADSLQLRRVSVLLAPFLEGGGDNGVNFRLVRG